MKIRNTIRIDIASKAEWPAVMAITKAAYVEYAERSDETFWRNYQQSIERTILTDESIIRFVARSESRILGSVLYCPPYERLIGDKLLVNRFPEMRLLAVPPEMRNIGIAGRLIDSCEEHARLSGFRTITLHTTALMETARKMYERRGYTKYPEIDFEPVPGFVVWGFWKNLNR